MAHLSGDESLIAAFAHGEDINAATAAKLFNKTLGEVTSEESRRAKTANFIIYGISAFRPEPAAQFPHQEAKRIIDGYFASYPGQEVYGQRGCQGQGRGLRLDDFRPAPLPQRHRFAQRHRPRPCRAKRRERSDSRFCGRHHEDRHDQRTPPFRRRRHPLEGDPAGA